MQGYNNLSHSLKASMHSTPTDCTVEISSKDKSIARKKNSGRNYPK